MAHPRRIIPYRRRARRTQRSGSAHSWVLVAVLLVLSVALVVGSRAWQVYERADDLRSTLLALESLTRRPPEQRSLEQVEVLLERTHHQAIALREEARPFWPIARSLREVPTYGADIAAAEPLLEVLIQSSAALTETLHAFRPVVQTATSSTTPTLSLVAPLHAARPGLSRAREHTAQASAALAQVPIADLSPSLRRRVAQLEPLLPLLDSGLEMTIAASEALTALSPVIAAWHRSPTITPELIANLHAARPYVRQTQETLRRASRQWQQVAPDEVPAPLRSRVQQVNERLPLIETGLDTLLTADDVLTALAPVLHTLDSSLPLPVVLTRHLTEAKPVLRQARQDLLHIQRTFATQSDLLAPEQAERIAETTMQLEAMLDLALVLPMLLGADQPREYLLIAQNPDELRATGGFLSNVGVLSAHQGTLTIPSLVVSERIDAQRLRDGPYFRNPAPLRWYMDIQQWAFRDSNWSPDFPTAARTFGALYNLSQGTKLRNVIAFNPYLLQRLLEATGPLTVQTVDGRDQMVSAQNVVAFMRDQYTAGMAIGNKDAIIDPLFATILNHIMSADATNLDALSLTQAFLQALDQHHLLLFIDDPEAAAILARQGWDGAVRPGGGDFLMTVETNVGYNKSNPGIQRAFSYTLDLSHPEDPAATLDIDYIHQGQPLGTCLHHRYPSFTSYQDMVERCYWNYLRVLVPSGSTLLDATRYPTPAEWLITETAQDGAPSVQPGVAGTTEFSTFLVVPSAEQRTVTFQYRLPASLVKRDEQGWHYRLKIQKQPGIVRIPTRVTLRLPDGAEVVSSSPAPDSRHGATVVFTLDLVQDEVLEVVFR